MEDLMTKSDSANVPRSNIKMKPKKRGRFWRTFLIIVMVLFVSGGSFLYGTNQGLQLREMLVGTVLSQYHPGLERILELLLPKSVIDQMLEDRIHPQVIQSKINRVKPEPVKAKVAVPSPDKVKVDTITAPNYTAKIMTISDPTTIHIVTTRFATKGQALSDLIKENNAVAGINAGGFVDPGGDGSGGQPIGTIISNGKVLSTPGSLTLPVLVGAFLPGGEFITGNYSVNQLESMGVKEAISFGPQLIVDGKDVVTPRIDGSWGWAPRTAIGQKPDGSVVMIITDGRFYWNKTHRGASMSDMAHLFQQYGVINAIAMDGGGSATMINNGQLQLQPATNTAAGMRYLPDAWVVIPKSHQTVIQS
jgi:exopolysaccharide biosynthesis protein